MFWALSRVYSFWQIVYNANMKNYKNLIQERLTYQWNDCFTEISDTSEPWGLGFLPFLSRTRSYSHNLEDTYVCIILFLVKLLMHWKLKCMLFVRTLNTDPARSYITNSDLAQNVCTTAILAFWSIVSHTHTHTPLLLSATLTEDMPNTSHSILGQVKLATNFNSVSTAYMHPHPKLSPADKTLKIYL